jgi:predicted DNA-binding transcriptional regulator AlpA
VEQRNRSVPQPSSNMLLTPEMICKALSISRRTLRSWVKQQVFPEPLRIGPDGRILRWHPDDVLDYLRSTRGQAGAQATLEELSEAGGAQERGR